MEENTLPISRMDVEKAYGRGCFPEFKEFAISLNKEKGINKFFLMGKSEETVDFVVIHRVYSRKHLSIMTGGE